MFGRLLTRGALGSPSVAVSNKDGTIRRLHSTLAGMEVTEATALGYPPLWRGSLLIASAVAGMPIRAWDVARRAYAETPRILEKPNPDETRVETMFAWVWSLLWHGNACGIIGGWDLTGAPGFIAPVHPKDLEVGRTPEGRRFYRLRGTSRTFDPWEVFHVKGPAMPGSLRGMGILEAQREGIGHLLGVEDFAARYFDEAGVPTAVFKLMDPDAGQEEADDLRTKWHLRGGRSREPLVLTSAVEFEALSVKADEAQLLEARRYSRVQAADMLNLDPRWLGSSEGGGMTYANLETKGQDLRTWTLLPWIQRLEAHLSALLPRDVVAKFDGDELERLDTKSAIEAMAQAVGAGLMDEDEARERLELPVRELVKDPDAQTMTTRELAEALQKIYLAVGKVITADEAREILNRDGAGLSGTFTPPAPPTPGGGPA